MLNIGHRGAMGHTPENTLLSIRKAIELGADWVEIDVHFVAGKLLVFHDDTLDRTTDGTGPLGNLSFSELRRLDAGEGERIPTLCEVIETTAGKVGLNIELKGKGTAAPVVELLASLTEQHRDTLLLSSFKEIELENVSELDSAIKLGVLVGRRAKESFEKSLSLAKRINAYSIHLNVREITGPIVHRAHQAALRVYVYTVNQNNDVQRMKRLGVDGVFTDFPDRVSELGQL